MPPLRWLSVGLLVFAACAAGAMLVQYRQAEALRSELRLLRHEHDNLARVRREHERLKAEQVSAAELERLRNDRAALVRLRGELEELKAGTGTALIRENSRRAGPASASTPPGAPSAVLSLQFAVSEDGMLMSTDGVWLDPAEMRTRLERLPRRARVDIRLQLLPPQVSGQMQAIKRNLRTLMEPAKELGLTFEVRFEPAAK